MSPKVLYLCATSAVDSGLVFPAELEENYYSPGGFYILKELYGKPHTFRAVYALQEISLELFQDQVLMDAGVWRVNHPKIGVFLFSSMIVDDVYAGKNPEFAGKDLIRLFPINESFLELACSEHKFFFIGDTE